MNAMTQLEALLQHARAERDRATAALRQAERLMQQAQSISRELGDYRADFDTRWMTHFQTAGPAELLHCQQGFGQRLDQAIAVQRTQAGLLGNRLSQAKSLLISLELRVSLVEKLISRRQADRQKTADRLDQLRSDEAALRYCSAAGALHHQDSPC